MISSPNLLLHTTVSGAVEFEWEKGLDSYGLSLGHVVPKRVFQLYGSKLDSPRIIEILIIYTCQWFNLSQFFHFDKYP